MFEDLSPVILFRMSERLVMTGIVIVVAVVVLIGFWKTVQRITLRDGGPLGIAGSVALSTPVLTLLAIILYAWVSLSHPISLGPPTASARTALTESGNAAQFTGAVPSRSGGGDTGTIDVITRQTTRQQIASINCLLATSDPGANTRSDLAEVKLTLMRGIWSPDWGSLPQFADWVRNPASDRTPNGTARALFEGRPTGC